VKHNTVSRRAALVGGAAGLIALLRWPVWLPADHKPLPEFSFLVVSDTHLGRGDQEGPARQWARTAKQIDSTAGDFVLHLGDVVDGGREAQYAVYKDIRKTIRKAVHEIPGNHDPQELFERHLRKPVELALDHKGVRFLLLNTRASASCCSTRAGSTGG
jgi:3',5'-cyclic-AMP phosphodiesterase